MIKLISFRCSASQAVRFWVSSDGKIAQAPYDDDHQSHIDLLWELADECGERDILLQNVEEGTDNFDVGFMMRYVRGFFEKGELFLEGNEKDIGPAIGYLSKQIPRTEFPKTLSWNDKTIRVPKGKTAQMAWQQRHRPQAAPPLPRPEIMKPTDDENWKPKSKINARISFRDIRRAYPGSAPASDYPSAFPANPFNPNAGEPRRFEGISTDAPQCPQCKVNLLLDNDKNIGSCPNCNSRFSKIQYDSTYSKKARDPALFSLDGGSNVDMDGGAQYHAGDKSPYGGASWTSSLGDNQHYNN